MASQGDNGIPLSHAPDGRGYRLLELPPELVSLLEADDSVVYVSASAFASPLGIPPLVLSSATDFPLWLLASPSRPLSARLS